MSSSTLFESAGFNFLLFYYILNPIFAIFHSWSTILPLRAVLIPSVGRRKCLVVLCFCAVICHHAKLTLFMCCLLCHFISMFTYLWLWNIVLIYIYIAILSLTLPTWNPLLWLLGVFAGSKGTRCPGTSFHPPTVTARPDKNRRVCLFYKCAARCPRGGTKMALVLAAPTQSQTQSD